MAQKFWINLVIFFTFLVLSKNPTHYDETDVTTGNYANIEYRTSRGFLAFQIRVEESNKCGWD
jgi:hypothetical protein